MSLNDLRRNIERSILQRQVLQRELEAKVPSPRRTRGPTTRRSRAEYTPEASVPARDRGLRQDETPGRWPRTWCAARAAGEDFADLAREPSIAPSAASGGDLGQVRRNDLAPDMDRSAFALPAGGVTDPLPAERASAS